jgi:hypothetical protein
MMKGPLVVAALALIGGIVGQVPQREVVLMGGGSYLAPPTTLEELWKHAELVALGRVVASHQRVAPPTYRGGSPSPFIVHQFQIAETLKGDLPGRQPSIQVLQPGGTVVSGGTQYTIVTDAFPILKIGQEAVLFLERPVSTDGRTVCFGPAGAFLLEDESVRVPSLVRQRMTTFSGKPLMDKGEFLKLLRSLR